MMMMVVVRESQSCPSVCVVTEAAPHQACWQVP